MWSIASLLAVGVLGLALARRMHRRGQSTAACVAAGALCIVNPFTFETIRLGEPQQLLAGALCVGVVLLALRSAAPGRRVRLLSVAAAAALVVALAPDPVRVAPAVVLAALWWASRRRTPDDALALLALMLLVTGAGHAAFIGSLVAWEGLTRRGLPAVSLLTSAAMLAVPSAGWYLPVALWLAARLYLPARTFRRVRAWPAPATQ